MQSKNVLVRWLCGLLLAAGFHVFQPHLQGQSTKSVVDFGAVADGVMRSDGAMTQGSAVLVSMGGTFSSADAGKYIQVIGAGPGATRLSDGSMSANSLTLNSASASFVAGDVGRGIVVSGAGQDGHDLVARIQSYAGPTSVNLSLPALTSISSRTVFYGAMTLEATIASVQDSNTAVLSSPALATISAAVFAYGTDNHASFQSALDSVGSSGGGTVLIPAPASCPSGASCGYVVKATDQQTSRAPGAIKIRYSGVSLVGDAPQTNLFCRGAFGTYSNSAAYPNATGNIRGFCLSIGDDGGPNGGAGTSVSNVLISKLHLYGMTNGNTFNVNFAYPPSPETTDGWDVTHKALYMWDGGAFSNITIDSVVIQDFKAENIYSGGSVVTGMTIENSTITNFNGNGISMLAADLQVLNNTISNGSNAGVENSTVSSGGAALVRQVYQGNTISNLPREGIVVVGVDSGVASGKVDIKDNHFDTLGQMNGSGTRSAVYISSQNGFQPPANVTVTGNTCTDCYSFGVFETSGKTLVEANTFVIDKYNAGSFLSFTHPISDTRILDNKGYGTANAQAKGVSIGAVYDINPGYQTGSFLWNGVILKGNTWTFAGAPQYRFVTSSGLAWGLVGRHNLNWQGDTCSGCTHADGDHGLVDLTKTQVIEPFGPTVFVLGNTQVASATVDASREEDGAQVEVVNAGATPVVFNNDANLSLGSSFSLAAGKSVTFVYSGSAGKFSVVGASAPPAAASIQATGGTPQSATILSAFANGLKAIVRDGGGNPLQGATVVFTVQASGASAAFASALQATVTTSVDGLAAAPTLTANGQAGSYTVTASVAGVAAVATFNLTNVPLAAPVSQSAGSLTGSGEGSSENVDLSVEGGVDWVHWGDQVGARKTGVSAQLGQLNTVGSGNVLAYSNDPRPVSWSDGTPWAAIQSNYNGVYISGIGQGFAVTAPADQTQRTLTVHVGGFFSGGILTAHLSDGSAVDYSDSTPVVSGQFDRNYRLVYRAGTAAQLITVTWVMSSGTPFGNVTINAAALSGSSLNAAAGTPQSTVIDSPFSTALSATLLGSSGAPIAGAEVTFTAVGNGASATFDGASKATVETQSNGVATAPPLTANSEVGSFQVVAVASGAGSPATFHLTNTARPPASILAAGGDNQQSTVGSSFASALRVRVVDSFGAGVGGIRVTFTAPASGPSAQFNLASTVIVQTGDDGIATSPVPVASSLAGSYQVSAAITGFPAVLFSLTNMAAPTPVTSPTAGALTGSVNTGVTTASLTDLGTVDWIHWGDQTLIRKANVTPLISDISVVGSGSAVAYNNDPRALNWIDGLPDGIGANNTNGLYTSATSDGLSFSVPATTTSQTLIIHVGGWLSAAKLTAHLSDASAPDYIDQTNLVNGQYDRTYTITFSAQSGGQSLLITWMNTCNGGNVTVSGAALQ